MPQRGTCSFQNRPTQYVPLWIFKRSISCISCPTSKKSSGFESTGGGNSGLVDGYAWRPPMCQISRVCRTKNVLTGICLDSARRRWITVYKSSASKKTRVQKGPSIRRSVSITRTSRVTQHHKLQRCGLSVSSSTVEKPTRDLHEGSNPTGRPGNISNKRPCFLQRSRE